MIKYNTNKILITINLFEFFLYSYTDIHTDLAKLLLDLRVSTITLYTENAFAFFTSSLLVKEPNTIAFNTIILITKT